MSFLVEVLYDISCTHNVYNTYFNFEVSIVQVVSSGREVRLNLCSPKVSIKVCVARTRSLYLLA